MSDDPILAALEEVDKRNLWTADAQELSAAAWEYARKRETWAWEFRSGAPRYKDVEYADALEAARARLISAIATASAALGQAAKDRQLPVGISLMAIPKVWPGSLEAEATAEITRLSTDLAREKAMHAVLAGKFKAAIEEQKRLRTENDTLRGLLAKSDKDCPYCGLSSSDIARCPSGFPGCARMDDIMAAQQTKAEDDLSQCRTAYNDAVLREERLRKALQPFADACDDLADEALDHWSIWEAAAAMNISASDLRAAKAALSAPVGEGSDGG